MLNIYFITLFCSSSVTGPSDLGVDELANSLKTSAISNTILRDELTQLQQQKDGMDSEMLKLRHNLEAKHARNEVSEMDNIY